MCTRVGLLLSIGVLVAPAKVEYESAQKGRPSSLVTKFVYTKEYKVLDGATVVPGTLVVKPVLY